ncbi:MAG: phosphoribosyltransferase family protein [Chromatiaceae bacterium]|nr:phosphoribosyltransferase family protein [Chromatiaceae bacterium]
MCSDNHLDPNQTLHVELATGTLKVRVRRAAFPLDQLCGFAARANPKRGFLFVSKVLGKHWPARPAAMEQIHRHLAQALAQTLMPSSGPWLFVAMAETATGLGQGVFEALLAQHPDAKALFLHSTRYRVPGCRALDFQEDHCHAPDQILYEPLDPEHQRCFATARELILIDDEISTGSTLCNLAAAYRARNPGLERVHFVSITNFNGEQRAAAFSDQLGLPVTLISALDAEIDFSPAPQLAEQPAPNAVGDNRRRLDQLAATGGRFGICQRWPLCASDVAALVDDLPLEAPLLVLGTGELMHPAFRIGRALELEGRNVRVQSTTRSPILCGADISQRLVFKDNYGEGIPNYLYNVDPNAYARIILCHETPSDSLMDVRAQLGARCVPYQTSPAGTYV